MIRLRFTNERAVGGGGDGRGRGKRRGQRKEGRKKKKKKVGQSGRYVTYSAWREACGVRRGLRDRQACLP